MYLGNTGTPEAPLAVVQSLVEDAVLGRGAESVRVELLNDGFIQIEDDGRSFREEDFSWSGQRLVPCFGYAANYLMVVCAVTEVFKAEGGHIRVPASINGKPTVCRVSDHVADNRVRLRLDGELLRGVITPEPYEVFGWAQEFAALISGIRLDVSDFRYGERTYLYPKGLANYLMEWAWVRNSRSGQIVYFTAEKDGIQLETALMFHYTGPKEIVSFVNIKRTVSHGTHVDGAVEALKEMLSEKFESSSFSLAVNVNIENPQFSGAVKERLIRKDVSRFVYDQFMNNKDEILRSEKAL